MPVANNNELPEKIYPVTFMRCLHESNRIFFQLFACNWHREVWLAACDQQHEPPRIDVILLLILYLFELILIVNIFHDFLQQDAWLFEVLVIVKLAVSDGCLDICLASYFAPLAGIVGLDLSVCECSYHIIWKKY